MKTTRLVGAFGAEGTCIADVAAIKEPDAAERDALVDQPLNEPLEDHVERSFLGQCERHLLQGLRLHACHITRYLVEDKR